MQVGTLINATPSTVPYTLGVVGAICGKIVTVFWSDINGALHEEMYYFYELEGWIENGDIEVLNESR